jgi:hypothetical protein
MIAYAVRDLVPPMILGLFGWLWTFILWYIGRRRWFSPGWSLIIEWLGSLGGIGIFIVAAIWIYRRTH